MGKCELCEKEIDDKYQLCMACNVKAKQANNQDDTNKNLAEIAKQLKHINWNMGLISQHMLGKKKVVKQIEEDMENEKHS